MAIIIDINEYRNKKRIREERARETLKEIFGSIETWESEEEKIRYYMDLAEKDSQEWTG